MFVAVPLSRLFDSLTIRRKYGFQFSLAEVEINQFLFQDYIWHNELSSCNVMSLHLPIRIIWFDCCLKYEDS